jgi:hypothetical protein
LRIDPDHGSVVCQPALTERTYFEGKELEFRKKAEVEKRELDRCVAMPDASAKYPTLADSARGLLQYYQLNADEFEQRATAHYLR